MATTPPAEGIASEMSKIESPIIDVVPFHLVSFKDRKTTKLLKNAIDHQSVKSQNKFFDFAFHKPLLITKCKILTQDFLDGSTFEYKWIGVDGKLVEGSASAKDNIVFIFVNGIARSISFKPPRAYFTKPLISNVEIFGFEVEKSDEFLNFAETVGVLRDNYIKKINNESEIIAKSKAELVALQAQRGSLTQDISSLKDDISREQGKLKRTEVQKNEILVQIGNLQRDLGADGSRLNELKIDTEVLTGRKTDLNIEVSAKKAELSELQSNIDLFPSELSSFSKQGAKDLRDFFWLSLIPIAIICGMFYLLLSGSADLTTKITDSSKINLAALAVSRSPYVIISCTVITACYYICKMLILEMVRISRQRLALTKISIIAKDISSSLDFDLNLSDDDRYNKRLSLKMDMMRDHLKEYLSTDFQPSLPENISPSSMLTSLKPDALDAAKEVQT